MVESELHRLKSIGYNEKIENAVSYFKTTPVLKFPIDEWFEGAGVYALYYKGNFKHYKPFDKLNETGFNFPIYVGKAQPTKSRANPLFQRLEEHRESINKGRGLKVDEFNCQLVIVPENDTDIIRVLEDKLIKLYNPLWNRHVKGFGNHAVGGRRILQSPSKWDVMHPGRANCTGPKPKRKDIEKKIEEYFTSFSTDDTIDEGET